MGWFEDLQKNLGNTANAVAGFSKSWNPIQTIGRGLGLQDNPNAPINPVTNNHLQFTDIFKPAENIINVFGDNIISAGREIGYHLPRYPWEKSQAQLDAEANVYSQKVFDQQRKDALQALIKHPDSPNREILLEIIKKPTAPVNTIPEGNAQSAKELAGIFSGLGLDVATLGTFPAGSKVLSKLPKLVRYGLEGAALGSGYGVSEGLKEDKEYKDIAVDAGLYGAGGLALGIGMYGFDRLINRMVQRSAVNKAMQTSNEAQYILNKTNEKFSPIGARDALDDAIPQILYRNGSENKQANAIIEHLKNIDTNKYKKWSDLIADATDGANSSIAQDIIGHINTRRVWINEPTFLNDLVQKEKLNITEDIFTPIRDELLNNPDLVTAVADKSVTPITEMAQKFNAGNYVDELVKAQSKARLGDKPTLVKRATDFYKDLKAKLVDFASPIEDVVANSQKKYQFEILPKADISNAIDRVLRAPQMAGAFLKEQGLDQVIKEAPNLDYLDQYLIAKQALRVEANGIRTGRNLEKDALLVKQLQPIYEPFAKKVTNYSQQLLEKSVDNGLISRELADKLKEIYPDYVPLNRIFSTIEKEEQPFGSKAIASLSKQTIVNKLQGSEREIESPIASLLQKTTDAFIQGEKNNAARILASYKELPGMKGLMRELPVGERATHKFSYLDNGVKKTIETTKEISNAAKALNVQQLNILGKILAAPVRVAKIGITGLNPSFILSNIARDAQFGFITSEYPKSLANPKTFLESLYNAAGHGKLYQDMVKAGAGGTSFDISRDQIPKTIQKIKSGKSIPATIKYNVTHPAELFRAAEDIVGRSEEFSRLQQFQSTRKALLEKGRTLEDATILAAKAARGNTANFLRRGEWGSVLNSAFLYLNASIQGSRAFIKAMKTHPVKTSAKVAVGLFTPMAITTAWNLSDEARKQVYEDIPDYEKENNLIIIPPQPVQDENGKWNVIKIPLPPGVSKLSIPIRKTIETTQGLDPVQFSDFAKSLIGTVLPVEPDTGSLLSTFTPQAIKPSVEAYTNKNFFTGLPQVSESMSKLSPELQVKDNTSGTAETIANTFNVSPIKTEEFIKSTFGGLSSNILNLSDRILAGINVLPEDKIGGKSFIESIKGRFTQATGGESEREQSKDIESIIQNQSDERFILKQQAELLDQELSALSPSEANAKVGAIRQLNPELFNVLQDTVEERKLGLTYPEKLLKMLWVSNGERAMYINEQANKFKTPQEKNAYIEDLKRKKIISPEVLEQLKELIRTGTIQQTLLDSETSRPTLKTSFPSFKRKSVLTSAF